MPWSPAFIAALARTTQITFTARKSPTFTLLPGLPGVSFDSATTTSGDAAISPGAALALSSQSLSIPSFAVSSSTWRFAIAGRDSGLQASKAFRRGSACEVRATAAGGGFSERIILGQARDVSGVGPQSIVSGWGALSLVISRPEAAPAPSLNDAVLFANCQPDGNALALSSPFNFGSHTTLQFASTPPFQRETGRPGAVLITPTSGDPYVVTYTGVSGNDLTGVSTSAIFGTSGTNAGAGDIVQEVCFVDRHPVDMALAILTSTGTGTNGTLDTLPQSWGLAVPVDLVDVQGFVDAKTALNASLASGTYALHTVATTPQGPPLQWLQTELARYGLWLCTRQGQISIRPALDYWRHAPPTVMNLGESNLLRALPERSNYDQSLQAEAVFFTAGADPLIVADAWIITEAPKTRPLIATIASGPKITTSPNVYQNAQAINRSIAERVGPWYLRVCTVIDCQATLEAAQLCVGDWVSIGHRGLWDHTTLPSTLRPTSRAMVTGISCDWSAGVVSLRLTVLHSSENA
jgi:hypothetical protein